MGADVEGLGYAHGEALGTPSHFERPKLTSLHDSRTARDVPPFAAHDQADPSAPHPALLSRSHSRFPRYPPLSVRFLFLSRVLSKLTFAPLSNSYFSESLTSPEHFADLFERGIDPDCADPSQINHWHSEVPTEASKWPAVEEIVEYEHRVRERVKAVYGENEGKWTRGLARVLMMVSALEGNEQTEADPCQNRDSLASQVFEHEA